MIELAEAERPQVASMLTLPVLTPAQCAEVQAIAASCERRKPGPAAGVASRSKDLAFIDVPAWLAEALQSAFAAFAAKLVFEAPPTLHTSADGCRPRCATYTVGSHFLWHVDIHQHQANRLEWISCSVQLSDPNTYAGGDLEIIETDEQPATGSARALELYSSRVRASRELGRATLFPSQWAHQVTPVTSGIRQSLVAWANVPRVGVDPATEADIRADQVRWLAERVGPS